MKRWFVAAAIAAMISAAVPSTVANAGTVCCAAGTRGSGGAAPRHFAPGTTAGSKGNAGLFAPWFWLP